MREDSDYRAKRKDMESPLNDYEKRTVFTILSCIAKYPQTLVGQYFLFKRILIDLKRPIDKRAVNLQTLRKLSNDDYRPTQGDKDLCANRVNQIHKQFNIPREVDPDDAIDLVTRFASMGLGNCIGFLSSVAKSKEFTAPYFDLHRYYGNDIKTYENFVLSNEEIYQALLNEVSKITDKYDLDSKRWQQEQRKVFTGETLIEIDDLNLHNL